MSRGRIVYLSTWQHQYTIRRWFDPPPGPDDPELLPVAYEEVARLGDTLPAATYVFTDTDRLDGDTMRAAVALARRVKAAGHPIANWPNLIMNRGELLTMLHQRGINGFACRRFTAPTGVRFPVFLRIDGTHDGAASPLIENTTDLQRAISIALAKGARREDILVVEFQDTDRFEGHFVKYAMFVAFGQAFAANMIVSRNWLAKTSHDRLESEEIFALELDWARSNPHAEAVTAVFRHAGIDWGRIDYGMHRGQIQVFEINTNPDLGGPEAWAYAERRDRYLIPVQLPNIRAAFRRLAAAPDRLRPAHSLASAPA
jgi:hypothetical protein